MPDSDSYDQTLAEYWGELSAIEAVLAILVKKAQLEQAVRDLWEQPLGILIPYIEWEKHSMREQRRVIEGQNTAFARILQE